MKDRTWFIEFGRCIDCPWWKPGVFRSTINGEKFRRAWWLGVCIAFVNLNLNEFCEYVGTGMTEWRKA